MNHRPASYPTNLFSIDTAQIILTLLLSKLMKEAGLSNPHITNDDVFEYVRVVIRPSRHYQGLS